MNKEFILNNFEAVSKSPKTMSYEEAQELLYMFYYSSGKYQREAFETLVLHLKERLNE